MSMHDVIESLEIDDSISVEHGGRPKLLLVDDDERLLRSLTRVLKSSYDIQTESNPYRALVALEDDGPFAAIVCDLTMPGVDGIEFLEQAHAEAPETPRVLLTGNATLPASIEAVNRAHITSLLTKPVAPEELLRSIDAAVTQHTELVDDLNTGAEILEGSVTALMETLAIANPTAFSLTKRVTGLVERYLESHPRNDGWEILMAARLCYLGSAALGADLSARVLHGEDLANNEDLLVGCVAGFTVGIVARIPRLANVEAILRQHRSYATRSSDGHLEGAEILGISTCLAELEAVACSRAESAGKLQQIEPPFDPDRVQEVLDVYLPVGEQPRPDIVDLTDGDHP
jgi:CheY-like chemotaxis protein